MGKKGIDIAKWNKINNYQSVRNAGVEFAIVKVNSSGSAPDGRFYEHVAGCSSAGIPVIAGYNYCYSDTEEKARRAADGYVNIAAPKGIKTMVLDLEDKSIMGLHGGIVKIIDIYRETAEAAGMKFIIYTGGHFYNPCLKPYEKDLADIPIWWARYPVISDRTITDPVPVSSNLPKDLSLCGWQYSSKGVIPGIQGYVDLDVWYEDVPMVSTEKEITAQYNPFMEPEYNVGIDTRGNDANWVQWHLWRFGKYVDAQGQPDSTQIDGVVDSDDVRKIKEVQELLGLEPDGIVGKITRAAWKKIC